MPDAVAASQSDPARRLPVGVMIAYGTGDVAQAAINVGIPALLLFYYQQIVELSGALTGLAIGIALFFDAVTDPVVGGLSDRLKGRFGRRHPLMVLAPLPLAISFVLLFSPPDGLSELGYFVWLTLFAVLVRASTTFFNIPHLALGAEMASDYQQRSTLFAFKISLYALATASIGITVYWLIFPTTPEFDPGLLDPVGYPIFAWSAGCLAVLAVMICVLGTAREIPHLRSAEPASQLSLRSLWRDMREVFRDRDFLVIFAGFILWYLFGFVEQAGIPFMGVHFWGLPTEQLAYSSVVLLTSAPVALLLAPLLTRKLDKKVTLVSCCLIAIVAPNVPICLRLFDVPWYPANGSPWVLINFLAAMWITMSAVWVAFTIKASIFADIADAHELRTGRRREGAIYSAHAFSNKAASALGMMIGGAILDLIAFPKNAVSGSVPDEVLWNLGFFVGPATSIFSGIGVLLFALYRIDRARHAEIVREMATRSERSG